MNENIINYIIDNQSMTMSVEQPKPTPQQHPPQQHPPQQPKPKPTNKNLGYTIACTRYNTQTWNEYKEWITNNQRAYEAEYKKPLKCIYGSPREISSRKIAPNSKILIIEMHNDENKIMGIGLIENKTASEVYRSKPPKPLTAAAHTLPNPPSIPSTAAAHTLPNPSSIPSTAAAHTLPNPSSIPSTISSTTIPSQGGGTPSGTPTIKYNIFSDRNYNRYIFIGNEYYISREEMERNIEHSELIEKIRKLDTLLFKGPRHSKRGSGFTKLAEWIIDAGHAIKI